jgi:predicted extracellular nuclease
MSRISCVIVMLFTSVALPQAPKLIITEIQFDPSSAERDEKQTEWVEIMNAGTGEVSLNGLQLTSGTKAKPEEVKQKFELGEATVKPGEYVVIGVGTPESYESLGLPTIAQHAGEAKTPWLANGGDSVAIRDEKGDVIDQVVYEIAAPWPDKKTGCTLQFVAPSGGDDLSKANDDPKNWILSTETNAESYPGHGKGTPGAAPKVDATTQPAAQAK